MNRNFIIEPEFDLERKINVDVLEAFGNGREMITVTPALVSWLNKNSEMLGLFRDKYPFIIKQFFREDLKGNLEPLFLTSKDDQLTIEFDLMVANFEHKKTKFNSTTGRRNRLYFQSSEYSDHLLKARLVASSDDNFRDISDDIELTLFRIYDQVNLGNRYPGGVKAFLKNSLLLFSKNDWSLEQWIQYFDDNLGCKSESVFQSSMMGLRTIYTYFKTKDIIEDWDYVDNIPHILEMYFSYVAQISADIPESEVDTESLSSKFLEYANICIYMNEHFQMPTIPLDVYRKLRYEGCEHDTAFILGICSEFPQDQYFDYQQLRNLMDGKYSTEYLENTVQTLREHAMLLGSFLQKDNRQKPHYILREKIAKPVLEESLPPYLLSLRAEVDQFPRILEHFHRILSSATLEDYEKSLRFSFPLMNSNIQSVANVVERYLGSRDYFEFEQIAIRSDIEWGKREKELVLLESDFFTGARGMIELPILSGSSNIFYPILEKLNSDLILMEKRAERRVELSKLRKALCVLYTMPNMPRIPLLETTNPVTHMIVVYYSLLESHKLTLEETQNLMSFDIAQAANGDNYLSILESQTDAVLQKLPQIMPRIADLIVKARMESAGLTPIGAKIHTQIPVDPALFLVLTELFGANTNSFQLIHANQSIILPPSVTALELEMLIRIISDFGLVSGHEPDVQFTKEGRWSPEIAAVVGASMLLGASRNIHYKPGAFETNHKETEARMMVHDAGGHSFLPFSIDGVRGRTDILGMHNVDDLWKYDILGTLATHKTYGGVFSKLWDVYLTHFEEIMKRHELFDLMHQSAWVHGSSIPGDSVQNHENMVCRFKAIWLEHSKKIGYGVIGEVQKLLSLVKTEMELMASDIATSQPEKYMDHSNY